MRFWSSRQHVRSLIGAVLLLSIEGALRPGRPGLDAMTLPIPILRNTAHGFISTRSSPAGPRQKSRAAQPAIWRLFPSPRVPCRAPGHRARAASHYLSLRAWRALWISSSGGCYQTHSTWSPRPAGRNGLTKACRTLPATLPAFFILPAVPPDPRPIPRRLSRARQRIRVWNQKRCAGSSDFDSLSAMPCRIAGESPAKTMAVLFPFD